MKDIEIKTILVGKESSSSVKNSKNKQHFNEILNRELKNGWKFKEVKYLPHCLRKLLLIFERETNNI